MGTSELKLKLDIINKITELKEIRVIEEIKKLLDFELDEDVYELSPNQQKRITKAREEYANGDFLLHEEVEKEMEQWLNEE